MKAKNTKCEKMKAKSHTVGRPKLERPLAELIPTSKFFPGPDLIALYFNIIQPPYVVSIS